MTDREKQLLDAALYYASLGWSVIPLHSINKDGSCSCGSNACRSKGKHPRTVNGVKDATTNQAMIRAWWSKNPKANVGIAMGKVSGMWCVDVDPRNGGDESILKLQLENDDLPNTRHVITGGGGEHYFFKYDNNIRNGKLVEGVDIKSDGGYVVAPPSVHASGANYSVSVNGSQDEVVNAPQWLLDTYQQSSSSSSKFEALTRTEVTADASEQFVGKVEEIRSALEVVDAEDREVWLQVGMALHATRGGTVAFDLWCEWASKSDKFDFNDSKRVWDSFQHGFGGVTIASVFAMAKASGWKDISTVKHAEESSLKILKRVESPKIPEHLLRPPGILADVADYITRTAIRPQPLFSLVAALSLCANVIGRRYESESGLRSNLYLVAIGATGCGKNHARSCIKRILTAAELVDNLGGEELASGQSILSRAAETPNVLFQLDEFGLLMKSVQNPNAGSHLAAILSILMKLFSSASDIYVGTEYANNAKRPRVTIEYPCVGIHATSTGSTFYESLDSKHVLSGYLNRLIVIESDLDRPKRQRKRSSRDIPLRILEWIALAANPAGNGSQGAQGATGVGNLSGVNPATPLMVVKTSDAAKMFDDYDEEIDVAMNATRGTGLDSLYNRAWEHADKIALVAAVADNPTEPVVDVEHAKFAIGLTQWSLECLVAQVQARVANSPFEARVKECLRAIKHAGERGMTEREMGRHSAFSKLTPKERLEVIASLTESEHIERVQFKTAGRPRVAYVPIADG